MLAGAGKTSVLMALLGEAGILEAPARPDTSPAATVVAAAGFAGAARTHGAATAVAGAVAASVAGEARGIC
jgi:hypothetical protein